MSTLDRLKALLPRNWYPDSGSPSLDLVMSAPAWMLDQITTLIQYIGLQTRISTATDRNLDVIATDYLGNRVSRRPSENDDSLRSRIKRELLRHRSTRAALDSVLYDLTGNHPRIFEFQSPADAGGYAHGNAYSGYAYGAAGGYGSLALPYQVRVDAYRPIENGGVANVGGYGSYLGGYGVGATEYITLSQVTAQVTDQDILAAIADTMYVNGVAWTSIHTAQVIS